MFQPWGRYQISRSDQIQSFIPYNADWQLDPPLGVIKKKVRTKHVTLGWAPLQGAIFPIFENQSKRVKFSLPFLTSCGKILKGK